MLYENEEIRLIFNRKYFQFGAHLLSSKNHEVMEIDIIRVFSKRIVCVIFVSVFFSDF